jgi:glycosyltransferase involved in cell wall biosynthesis
MHIGVVPHLSLEDGGVRQYSLSMLHALRAFANALPTLEITVVVPEEELPKVRSYMNPAWSTLPPAPPARASVWRSGLDKARVFVGEGPHRELWRTIRSGADSLRAGFKQLDIQNDVDRVRWRPDISRWYRSRRIDLMLYPLAHSFAFEVDIPYMVAIHDLQHRLQPKFAEVSAKGEWIGREYLYRNAARHATLIVADSDVGREDIMQCYGPYGVDPDHVRVLPYCPPPYFRVGDPTSSQERARKLYSRLPKSYLFYPANFWPSKNHLHLVEALVDLRARYGLCIPLVLCGSRGGPLRDRTFRDVMAAAERGGVTQQVCYLGYVPDELIAGLFAGATGLVMPTFFGPTNIPVVESWAVGCPVITSRLHGITEHVGDAALLVNPTSVREIAEAIRALWIDEELRASLAQRGRKRGAAYTGLDFNERFSSVMEEAILRVARATGDQGRAVASRRACPDCN